MTTESSVEGPPPRSGDGTGGGGGKAGTDVGNQENQLPVNGTPKTSYIPPHMRNRQPETRDIREEQGRGGWGGSEGGGWRDRGGGYGGGSRYGGGRDGGDGYGGSRDGYGGGGYNRGPPPPMQDNGRWKMPSDGGPSYDGGRWGGGGYGDDRRGGGGGGRDTDNSRWTGGRDTDNSRWTGDRDNGRWQNGRGDARLEEELWGDIDKKEGTSTSLVVNTEMYVAFAIFFR